MSPKHPSDSSHARVIAKAPRILLVPSGQTFGTSECLESFPSPYKSAAKKAPSPIMPADASCTFATAAPLEVAEAEEAVAEPLLPPFPLPLPLPFPLPPLPPVGLLPDDPIDDDPTTVLMLPALPRTDVVVLLPTTVNEVRPPLVWLRVITVVPETPAGMVATGGCVVTRLGWVVTATAVFVPVLSGWPASQWSVRVSSDQPESCDEDTSNDASAVRLGQVLGGLQERTMLANVE